MQTETVKRELREYPSYAYDHLYQRKQAVGYEGSPTQSGQGQLAFQIRPAFFA